MFNSLVLFDIITPPSVTAGSNPWLIIVLGAITAVTVLIAVGLIVTRKKK